MPCTNNSVCEKNPKEIFSPICEVERLIEQHWKCLNNMDIYFIFGNAFFSLNFLFFIAQGRIRTKMSHSSCRGGPSKTLAQGRVRLSRTLHEHVNTGDSPAFGTNKTKFSKGIGRREQKMPERWTRVERHGVRGALTLSLDVERDERTATNSGVKGRSQTPWLSTCRSTQLLSHFTSFVSYLDGR